MSKARLLFALEDVEKNTKRLRQEIEADDELDKLSLERAEKVRDLRKAHRTACKERDEQMARAEALARDNHAMRKMIDEALGIDSDIREELGKLLGLETHGAIGAVRLLCKLWNTGEERAVKALSKAAFTVVQRRENVKT